MRLPRIAFTLLALLSVAELPAGEIIVTPEPSGHRSPGAGGQRERAAAYQRGSEITPPEEDGGFLAPRSGAPAEARAYENRARARAYQAGSDQANAALLPAAPGDTARERGRDPHSRVRVQTGSGNPKDIDLSHVGPDGIPVIVCRSDVDNVSARIGEDAASGSLFYIMRNGRPVKVRCK